MQGSNFRHEIFIENQKILLDGGFLLLMREHTHRETSNTNTRNVVKHTHLLALKSRTRNTERYTLLQIARMRKMPFSHTRRQVEKFEVFGHIEYLIYTTIHQKANGKEIRETVEESWGTRRERAAWEREEVGKEKAGH